MAGLGLDPGTMWICRASIDDVDDSGVSFEIERNVFAEVRKTLEDPETILKDNNYAYIKHKDNFYVVGEDVFKVHEIESLFKGSGSSSYFSQVRRPMKDGLINTAEDKMSIAIIQSIIKKLVGKPKYPGEVLCFCAPGDPVNSNSNVLFHRMMLTNFIKSLGYTPECINEAVAIIFSEAPKIEDPDEPGGFAKFSGLSFSMGAGMCNVALVYKQLPLLTFSVCHSGDYIDQEAAKIAGCDVATITKYKENHLDLSRVDESNLKASALSIYYSAMIENAVKHFAARFEKLEDDEKINKPFPIVVAGGTASVPGFIDRFSKIIQAMELPFTIGEIRLAKNPLYAVANGCLTKAISIESKSKKVPSDPSKPEETSPPTKDKASQKIKLNKD